MNDEPEMSMLAYRILAGLFALVAGAVIVQGWRNKKLTRQLREEELKNENLEIEKSVHNLSDDDLRRVLDDKLKKGK